MSNKKGVVLMNLGSPDSTEERIFNGRKGD